MIVYGQPGVDEVLVRGTPAVDAFVVTPHAVAVNDGTVQLFGVETLSLDTGLGDDDVQTLGRLGFRVHATRCAILSAANHNCGITTTSFYPALHMVSASLFFSESEAGVKRVSALRLPRGGKATVGLAPAEP